MDNMKLTEGTATTKAYSLHGTHNALWSPATFLVAKISAYFSSPSRYARIFNIESILHRHFNLIEKLYLTL